MIYRNSALAAGLLLLAVSASAATGSSGASFLKLGAGARAGAMADAFTAIADDAFAAYYNPAGLARLSGAQFGGAHSALFQGISYQSLVLVVPFGPSPTESGGGTSSPDGSVGRSHALGLSIYYLGVGDVERRTGDSTNPVGTLNAADSAYAGTYSHAPNDRLSLGVTGKYIHQTIDTYSANSMAVDLGVLYRVTPSLGMPVNLGIAIRNVGKKIGFVSSQADPLPTTVVVGAAAALSKGFTADIDVGKARDNDVYTALGMEGRKTLSEGVVGAARFGYTTSRRDNGGLAGVTAGGGLAFRKANFDFAWIPFGALGDAFRFSLLVKF